MVKFLQTDLTSEDALSPDVLWIENVIQKYEDHLSRFPDSPARRNLEDDQRIHSNMGNVAPSPAQIRVRFKERVVSLPLFWI